MSSKQQKLFDRDRARFAEEELEAARRYGIRNAHRLAKADGIAAEAMMEAWNKSDRRNKGSSRHRS